MNTSDELQSPIEVYSSAVYDSAGIWFLPLSLNIPMRRYMACGDTQGKIWIWDTFEFETNFQDFINRMPPKSPLSLSSPQTCATPSLKENLSKFFGNSSREVFESLEILDAGRANTKQLKSTCQPILIEDSSDEHPYISGQSYSTHSQILTTALPACELKSLSSPDALLSDGHLVVIDNKMMSAPSPPLTFFGIYTTDAEMLQELKQKGLGELYPDDIVRPINLCSHSSSLMLPSLAISPILITTLVKKDVKMTTRGIAFSPDSKYTATILRFRFILILFPLRIMASSYEDGLLCLWSIKDLKKLCKD